MALQDSGQINLSDIVNEFGDTTPDITKLSEFYGVASNIPKSGTIKFSDFYGRRTWIDGFPQTATTSNTNLLWVPTNEMGVYSITQSNGGLQLMVPPTTKIVALNIRSWRGTPTGDFGKIFFLDFDDLMQGTFTPVYDLVPTDVSSSTLPLFITDITDTHFVITQRTSNGTNVIGYLYSYTYNPSTQTFSATKQTTYTASPTTDNPRSFEGRIPRNDVILFTHITYSSNRGRIYQYDFSGNLVETYDNPDNNNQYWGRYISYNKKYISVSSPVAFADERTRTMIFEYDSGGRVSTVVNRIRGRNSYEPGGRKREPERFLFFGDLLVREGIRSTGASVFWDEGNKTWYNSPGLQIYDYDEFDTNGNLDYYKQLDSWSPSIDGDEVLLNAFNAGVKRNGRAEIGGGFHDVSPIIMSDEYVKNNQLIGTWGEIWGGYTNAPDEYYAQLYDIYNDSIHFYHQFDLHDFRSDITATHYERHPPPMNIIAREEGIIINYNLKDSATNGYSGFGIAIPRN